MIFCMQQEKIARNRKNLFNVVEQLKWYVFDASLLLLFLFFLID